MNATIINGKNRRQKRPKSSPRNAPLKESDLTELLCFSKRKLREQKGTSLGRTLNVDEDDDDVTMMMQRKEAQSTLLRKSSHLSLLRVRGAVAGADLLDVDTVVEWVVKEKEDGRK